MATGVGFRLGPLRVSRATTWLRGHHVAPGLGSSFPRWLHWAVVVGRCSLLPHGDVGLDCPPRLMPAVTCSPVPFPVEGRGFSDRWKDGRKAHDPKPFPWPSHGLSEGPGEVAAWWRTPLGGEHCWGPPASQIFHSSKALPTPVKEKGFPR